MPAQIINRRPIYGRKRMRFSGDDCQGRATQHALAAFQRGSRVKHKRKIHAGFGKKPLRFGARDVFYLKSYGRKALGKESEPVDHDGRFKR